jgi:hypothetical protein
MNEEQASKKKATPVRAWLLEIHTEINNTDDQDRDTNACLKGY